MNYLTDKEEEIMLCIWELGGGYMKDIHEKLDPEKIHRNTLSTYLKILVEKGFIRPEKHLRIHFYQIEIGKEDYAIQYLIRFADRYYKKDKNLAKKIAKNKKIKKHFHL